MNPCSRDLTAIKIKTLIDGGLREIILGSAYLPYDDAELPPPWEVDKLVMSCRAAGNHLNIGCDGNSITYLGEVQISITKVSPCLIILWLMKWT
jgi:hypothetical protein